MVRAIEAVSTNSWDGRWLSLAGLLLADIPNYTYPVYSSHDTREIEFTITPCHIDPTRYGAEWSTLRITPTRCERHHHIRSSNHHMQEIQFPKSTPYEEREWKLVPYGRDCPPSHDTWENKLSSPIDPPNEGTNYLWQKCLGERRNNLLQGRGGPPDGAHGCQIREIKLGRMPSSQQTRTLALLNRRIIPSLFIIRKYFGKAQARCALSVPI